ncbi:sigma 54-interacting transcriptional regulator [Clostridioides difficile]|nr:sigma 54-interacting transcriptional regulator [Clostridioides difficile]
MVKESSNFVVFNCADYSDNPQLLLSLLFGYKKVHLQVLNMIHQVL